MTTWKVYYDDGETVSNRDHTPETAPRRGVQAIVQPDVQNGFRLLTDDYYLWSYDHDRWWCADHFGLWDYLVRKGTKVVLFGRSITEEEFDAVYQDALHDDLFGDKTGFREREHVPISERDDFRPGQGGDAA